MPERTRLPGWFLLLLAVLALAALARACGLVLHRPLLAYANNYDQIRYSACLDLAPWRPGERADRGHPQAPLSRYAFQPIPPGLCVWSSDLLFTAPVAAAWRMSEASGARSIHSVHRLAEWRLLAWLLLAGWTVRALLGAGQPQVAAAYLGWLALFGHDPANLLYFPTFYAEAGALLGFHACLAGVAVALLHPTRASFMVAAVGAAILAGSKQQHLVLPLLLGLALLVGAGRARRMPALALLVGGLAGLALQLADLARATPVAQAVDRANRANFVLTVLLPESSDPARVAAALDLEPACIAYAGRSIYAMPLPVERICTRVGDWARAEPWWLLLSDPPATARALLHIPRLLLPWIPPLGVVEGATWGALPSDQPSWNRVFGDRAGVAAGVLLLPWLVAAGAWRRRERAALGFALACAVGSAGVALVSLFGDGDVDFAKHAQLAPNFALASLGLVFAALLRRALDAGAGR